MTDISIGLVAFIDDRLKRLGLKAAKPDAVLLTSCGAEATAGLNELVKQGDTRVVASSRPSGG